MSRQSLAYAVIRDTTQKKHIRVLSKAKIIPKYSQSQSYAGYAGLLPFKSLGHFPFGRADSGMIRKKIHARCTFCPLIFMTKVLQALPALGDYHLWMTWGWLTSPLSAAVKPEAPNANTASRMICMGKFWKAPWKWEPRLGPYDWWMMQRWWKHIWKHIQFAHSAPNPDTYLAMTGHLLPVHGFEKIKKRHLAGQGFRYGNDILGLGKQEDWHRRMSFFARRFKHYRPHLQEISGKKGLKKATAHGPETSRSIATAQNMHNLLPFSEEHPQSKALPWSRANNENHSRINCCQPHICRSDGSSPLCLNYVQIWTHQISDWIWLGFNGYHYWLHAWPGPARAAKTNKASAWRCGGLQPTWYFAFLVGGFHLN